jgi:hypothetical protein
LKSNLEKRPPSTPSGSPSRTKENKPFVEAGDRLRKLAELRDERKELYGDNYLRAGYAMAFMLGQVTLKSPRDYVRMGLLVQEFSKLSRYSIQWKEGHQDSLDDLAVYAQILAEVDGMTNEMMSRQIAKSVFEE